MDGYHCYGCDPNSPQGLRMEFYENGDEIVSVCILVPNTKAG